jgi:hypothetical protein
MRQKLFLKKERWMPILRQKKTEIFVFSANQEACSTRAYLTKQFYK